ncbi:hypothetical protein [Ramlibacter humi]|uniref:Uncharacterized protein n=1 Tax=Ramlibacter humi TaxID=2530451 RepID=A0A4Z0BI00_9BURK|nr:hypothetical protein [Ramlibacter humi]TFY98351.1 hypothetical protein EZ216_17340 [Ramlibacter humi]
MRRQVLALLLALPLAAAHAQGAAPADCPKAADVTPRHLVGLWRAEFADGGAGATLLLEPHKEYAQSLSGEINRNGEKSRVAADLEDGAFTLEESADGRRISATWLGDLVEGSCGREIRGQWKPEGGGQERNFVLRRVQGW